MCLLNDINTMPKIYLTTAEAKKFTKKTDYWLSIHATKHKIGARTYYVQDELEAVLAKLYHEQVIIPPPDRPRPSEEGMLTTRDVADDLKVSPGYVSYLIKADKPYRLPAVNISHKQGRAAMWRIERSEYERWKETRPRNIAPTIPHHPPPSAEPLA